MGEVDKKLFFTYIKKSSFKFLKGAIITMPLKILCAIGNNSLREQLTEALRLEGYEVSSCDVLREVQQNCSPTKPHMIIMDSEIAGPGQSHELECITRGDRVGIWFTDSPHGGEAKSLTILPYTEPMESILLKIRRKILFLDLINQLGEMIEKIRFVGGTDKKNGGDLTTKGVAFSLNSSKNSNGTITWVFEIEVTNVYVPSWFWRTLTLTLIPKNHHTGLTAVFKDGRCTIPGIQNHMEYDLFFSTMGTTVDPE